jgi:hypothetical protein
MRQSARILRAFCHMGRRLLQEAQQALRGPPLPAPQKHLRVQLIKQMQSQPCRLPAR